MDDHQKQYTRALKPWRHFGQDETVPEILEEWCRTDGAGINVGVVTLEQDQWQARIFGLMSELFWEVKSAEQGKQQCDEKLRSLGYELE